MQASPVSSLRQQQLAVRVEIRSDFFKLHRNCMNITWPELKAVLSRPLGALVLLLFAVQLFASQPWALSEQQPGTGHAYTLTGVFAANGHEAGSDTQQCKTPEASSVCVVKCPVPYVLKSSSAAVRDRASLAFNFAYLFLAGRLVSGPDPFPPKAPLSS